MPVLVVSPRDHNRHLHLIAEMHRLRYRVFKDRLNWDVSTSGEMEIDAYDALKPHYLIGVDEAGAVVGCARLLPSTGPMMLTKTFPVLLGSQRAPESPAVYESSRFCVDTTAAKLLAGGGLRHATYMMLAGVLEWGIHRQLEAIATVTDTRFERILQRTGWCLARFDAPRRIGDTMAVAGMLAVSGDALSCVRAAGGLDRDVLVLPADARQAA